jgi:putative ABC transport system substrate-binding protein
MRRRRFIALLGGLAASPLVAKAQPSAKIYRIGILSPERLPFGMLEAFQQGLHEFGYIEGKNIALEMRDATENSRQLAGFANELVALKVDVIIAVNTPAAQAAKKATSAIPIIMTRLADPVKSGLVPSLANPGGNITGVSFMSDELSGKRLALLKGPAGHHTGSRALVRRECWRDNCGKRDENSKPWARFGAIAAANTRSG